VMLTFGNVLNVIASTKPDGKPSDPASNAG
jgi:hypothetical protein